MTKGRWRKPEKDAFWRPPRRERIESCAALSHGEPLPTFALLSRGSRVRVAAGAPSAFAPFDHQELREMALKCYVRPGEAFLERQPADRQLT